MTTAIAGFLAFIGALVIVTRYGWAAVATVAIVGAYGVLPRDLGGLQVFGTPVTTQLVAVALLCLVSIFGAKRGGGLVRLIPFVALLLLIGAQVWVDNGLLSAGIFGLIVAVVAWTGGYYVGRVASGDRRLEQVIVVVVFGVILIQAVVTLLQAAGFDVFTAVGRTAELTDGRSSGTLGHPGTLGKIIILLVLMVLPLTQSTERRVRRIATLTVVLSLVPIGLSESRANFASLIAMVALWALILPRTNRLRTRIALPLLALIVGLLFLEPILARITNDPSGGERDRFLAVALEHIPENLWFGVGPNGYVDYFGQYDTLTAAGWPVHNAFLLTIAEIGIIGALLLFVPTLIAPAVLAMRSFRSTGAEGLHARAILASIIAVVILGTTGWGMMSTTVLPMWMFVAAYLAARARTADPAPDELVDDGSTAILHAADRPPSDRTNPWEPRRA